EKCHIVARGGSARACRSAAEPDTCSTCTGQPARSSRYGSHSSGTAPWATIDHVAPRGATGWRCSRIVVSCSRRSRLRTLHGRQAATTFSHVCVPPRDRGTTWSIESALLPQYWHMPASRAMTARRLTATRRRNGTLTNVRSRTTDGTGTTSRSECRARPVCATASALTASTSTTARRAATTHSGSYEAFSTNALVIGREVTGRAGTIGGR